MHSEKLIIERKAKVLWLTLNRPEVHNALDNELLFALTRSLEELREDKETKVIVIRGAGKSFCSGADLKKLGAEALVDRNFTMIQPKIFDLLSRVEKVVIASVHGVALGGGMGLVAACDMAIAAENAVFALPEIDLGYFPSGQIGPLVRSIGRKTIAELCFMGRRLNAQEALGIGLVNAVVPNDKLEEATFEMASALAEKDYDALAQGKELLAMGSDMEYSKLLRYSADMVVLAATKKARCK